MRAGFVVSTVAVCAALLGGCATVPEAAQAAQSSAPSAVVSPVAAERATPKTPEQKVAAKKKRAKKICARVKRAETSAAKKRAKKACRVERKKYRAYKAKVAKASKPAPKPVAKPAPKPVATTPAPKPVSTVTATSLGRGLTMTPAQAKTALGALPVATAHSMAGYSRDEFPHWRTATAWGWPASEKGCDARQATLKRDGDGVVVNTNCTPTAGSWTDPYTGTKITTSRSVDVDHIVPLAAAWRSGADAWTENQRIAYANNPLVIVASGASANRAKGDKGPEAWKPANTASHCAYATRWVAVKKTYTLNVTSAAEKSALTSMLATC